MLKFIEKSIISGLLITFLFNLTTFANNCDDLSSKVLRLHIIANSDSKTDQDLKIKVRDKIIEKSGAFLESAKDKESAQTLVLNNLDNLQEIAVSEIKQQGFNYSVNSEITNMYFPTRKYDTVTLPAGRYDALRLIIGEGKGKNWWCVIFPQMCLGCAKKSTTADTLFNSSEKDIISNGEKYEIKFKVVEWFYSIKSKILNLLN